MNPQLNVGATRTVYSDERYFEGIDRHPSAHDPEAQQEGLAQLLEFVQQHKPVVLTGAGVSTLSGIPDYRGPAGLRRDTSPVRYQEIAQDVAARQKYWARSFAAWPSMAAAQPNIIHHKLARWLDDGFIADIVTQNVDRLHHRAGAYKTIELHGTLYLVRCLDCGELSNRDYFQERLAVLNDGLDVCLPDSTPQPDGDMNVSQKSVDEFTLVTCLECSGTRMKPDVVFFGENVPGLVRARVDDALDRADSLLVLGSSLAVMSSLRLVRKMVKDGKPVFIVTSGVTRADALPVQRLDCMVQDALEYVTRALPDRELPGMDDLEPESAALPASQDQQSAQEPEKSVEAGADTVESEGSPEIVVVEVEGAYLSEEREFDVSEDLADDVAEVLPEAGACSGRSDQEVDRPDEDLGSEDCALDLNGESGLDSPESWDASQADGSVADPGCQAAGQSDNSEAADHVDEAQLVEPQLDEADVDEADVDEADPSGGGADIQYDVPSQSQPAESAPVQACPEDMSEYEHQTQESETSAHPA